MAVEWSKYHICMKYGQLRIGRGNISKSGIQSIDTYSEDRTEEIINAVAGKLKSELDKKKDDKGYVGYNVPNVGKLVLISPNYEFEVKKKQKQRQKKY